MVEWSAAQLEEKSERRLAEQRVALMAELSAGPKVEGTAETWDWKTAASLAVPLADRLAAP